MKPSLATLFCGAAMGALACAAVAQNSPPAPPPPPFSTPQKAASPESPQNTANARGQAEADYKTALARCDARPEIERQACINEAEEHFYGALSGETPGLQGNPGSDTGTTETGK